jgi:hypothetical protein
MALTKVASSMVGDGSGQAFNPSVPIYENTKTVTASYTITAGACAMSVGPITLNAGVTVTIPSGARWVVL